MPFVPVAPGDPSQPDDVNRSGGKHHEPAQHGREEKVDGQRCAPMHGEESDLDFLEVLEDEDQQDDQQDQSGRDRQPRGGAARRLRGVRIGHTMSLT